MLLGVHQAHGDVLVHEEQDGAHQGGEERRPAGPDGEGHEGHQPRAADGGGQRCGHGERGEGKGVPARASAWHSVGDRVRIRIRISSCGRTSEMLYGYNMPPRTAPIKRINM